MGFLLVGWLRYESEKGNGFCCTSEAYGYGAGLGSQARGSPTIGGWMMSFVACLDATKGLVACLQRCPECKSYHVGRQWWTN